MRSPKLRSRVALPTRSYVRCGPANEASRAKKAKAPPPSEEGSGRRSFYVHKEDGQKENSLTPLRSEGPGFVPGHSMRHRRPPCGFSGTVIPPCFRPSLAGCAAERRSFSCTFTLCCAEKQVSLSRLVLAARCCERATKLASSLRHEGMSLIKA